MRKRLLSASERLHGLVHRYTHSDETAFFELEPQDGNARGRALLAYIAEPFRDRTAVSSRHTHYGESVQMAETLLEMGYAVDVISYRNTTFRPRRRYDLFLSARVNFERIADRLNEDCIKVVHLDMAHWLFNNAAAYQRALDVQRRRGATLALPRKQAEQNWAIERADYATVLGNEFTMGTFAYAGTPMFPLPIPSAIRLPWPDGKDFDAVRRHFIWFGSDGLVHKGLDLALEAFARMPDCHLTVCGPVSRDPRFQEVFHDLLYETSNITTRDWIDVAGPEFERLTRSALGVVYPSASEGQAGAVVTCLQAGLIPIVSPQTGVDVADFGIVVDPVTIDEICARIREISGREPSELEAMARSAWSTARSDYTRETYGQKLRAIIESIEGDRGRAKRT